MLFGLFHRRSSRRHRYPVRPVEQPAPWSPRPSPGEHGRSDLADLADETEAFLRGHLAEQRAATGGPLAAWMVVNRVGHGDPVDIFTMVAGHLNRPSLSRVHLAYLRVWNGAQRAIASRLLEETMDPDRIRQLQQDVLIPLELDLARRSQDEPLTFPEVTAAALEALDRRRLDR